MPTGQTTVCATSLASSVPLTRAAVMQAEVDRLEHLIDAHANRADYILEAAEQNIDSFEATLERQDRRQEHRKQVALQRQRQALAKAAAQEMVNERRQRMSSLRQVPFLLLMSLQSLCHQ